MSYDSLLPKEIPHYKGNLILTTKREAPQKCDKIILHEDIFEEDITIIHAKMLQVLGLGYQDDELIIGIDPGQQIGLSVSYSGRHIESSHHHSVERLVMRVITILGRLRAKKKIIKIGNGDMNNAMEIKNMLNLKFCSSFELEFVDEWKTSPKIKNHNQRGKRDMLSAKFISQREGFRHNVLPLSMTG